MSNVEWDDQKVARRQDHFKTRQGMWDRIVVLDKQATMHLTHYIDGLRYVACTKPTEKQCYWHTVSDKEERERFGAIICIYSTNDKDGSPTSPLDFEINWWPFGPDKFEVLRVGKTQFGDLREHDLLIQGEGEDRYQKMKIHVMPDAWWTKDKVFQTAVVDAYKEFKANCDLDAKLARHIPFVQQPEAHAKAKAGKDGKSDRQEQRQGPNPGFNPTSPAAGGGPTFSAAPEVPPIPSPTQNPLDATAATPTAPSPEVVTQSPPAQPETSTGTQDLDSMLADIDG